MKIDPNAPTVRDRDWSHPVAFAEGSETTAAFHDKSASAAASSSRLSCGRAIGWVSPAALFFLPMKGEACRASGHRRGNSGLPKTDGRAGALAHRHESAVRSPYCRLPPSAPRKG